MNDLVAREWGTWWMKRLGLKTYGGDEQSGKRYLSASSDTERVLFLGSVVVQSARTY